MLKQLKKLWNHVSLSTHIWYLFMHLLSTNHYWPFRIRRNYSRFIDFVQGIAYWTEKFNIFERPRQELQNT
jgi:hypothetical protein